MLVDVPITRYRAELKRWLDLVRTGEEVVITDRGVPIARLTGVSEQAIIERLEKQGRLSVPEDPTPLDIDEFPRVHASESISDIVSAMRD